MDEESVNGRTARPSLLVLQSRKGQPQHACTWAPKVELARSIVPNVFAAMNISTCLPITTSDRWVSPYGGGKQRNSFTYVPTVAQMARVARLGVGYWLYATLLPRQQTCVNAHIIIGKNRKKNR